MKPGALLLFPIAVSLLTPAVNAQSLPDAAGKALSDVATGVSDIFGAILNPVESDFRKAEKEGRLADALAIYEKNEPSLTQNKDLTPQIQHVLDYARTTHGSPLLAALEKAKRSLSTETFKSDFILFDATVQSLSKAKDDYLAAAKIVRSNAAGDSLVIETEALWPEIKTKVHANLGEIYARFPHEKKKLSLLFSDRLQNEPDLFRANWDRLGKRLSDLSDPEAADFLRNTSDAWSNSPDLRSRIAATLWTRAAARQDDVIAAYSFSSQLARYGLATEDWKARPQVVAIDATSKGEVPLRVTGTTILKTSVADAFGQDLALPNEPTVVVYLNEAISRRKIIDKKEVESQYRSGSRLVPNPNYAIAEMECNRAQSDLAAQRARNTIAPARGWGALLQGVAEGLTAANVQQVCNRFASTPPSTEEDVYERYTYTVSEIEITRGIRGYTLAVGGSETVDAAPIALEEKKVLKVAYGRKDSDRTPAEGLSTDAEMENAAKAPFAVDLQKLLLESSHTERKPRTKVEALALLKPSTSTVPTMYAAAKVPSDAAPTTSGAQQISYNDKSQPFSQALEDARVSSVVVVLNPRGSIGAGFYVAPNEILTNYHVVEGASVIELRSPDGQLFSGRVVKKDIGTDVALLRVERLGQPVQFAQAILRPGETVEAIGHPKGLFFSISRGVVSAIRQMKGLLASGSDKALVIQTDTAINPGNSGGPLFVKDRVVGMNTVKMKGAEGIGFAIHYSELLRFLSE